MNDIELIPLGKLRLRFRVLAASEPDEEAPVEHEPDSDAGDFEPADEQDAHASETVDA